MSIIFSSGANSSRQNANFVDSFVRILKTVCRYDKTRDDFRHHFLMYYHNFINVDDNILFLTSQNLLKCIK